MGCLLSRFWHGSDEIEVDDKRFSIVRKIATGGFSEVYLVETARGRKEKMAMKKIVIADEADVAKIQWEVDMHKKHRHERVVPLLLIARPEENTFCLFFPFYENGTLSDLLLSRRPKAEYLTQQEAVRIFLGICEGVQLLHGNSIAHRDLKPANVLLTLDRQPKLTDFGSSHLMPIVVADSRDSLFRVDEAAEVSSMPYRAPELFTCYAGTSITTAIDIWSLGCLLYAMCYFVSPFDLVHEAGNSIALAAQNPQTIPFPDNAPFDSRVISIVQTLLKVEPDDRPSIDITVTTIVSPLLQ